MRLTLQLLLHLLNFRRRDRQLSSAHAWGPAAAAARRGAAAAAAALSALSKLECVVEVGRGPLYCAPSCVLSLPCRPAHVGSAWLWLDPPSLRNDANYPRY